MRLYSMTNPNPLEVAVGASRPHFALAAGLSDLVNNPCLAPTFSMRDEDRSGKGFFKIKAVVPLTQSQRPAGCEN